METFGKFRFKILKDDHTSGFYYQIYTNDLSQVVSTSVDSFWSTGLARYAAIGQITLIEKNTINFQDKHL